MAQLMETFLVKYIKTRVSCIVDAIVAYDLAAEEAMSSAAMMLNSYSETSHFQYQNR